jgi:hypothetical protein
MEQKAIEILDQNHLTALATTRARKFQADDLAAGREYVARYVAFVHYVEALHQATQASASGHYADAEASESPHRE